MEDTARKTHPLILIAAAAVTIASLAAAAHFSGLLPAKSGPDSPSTVAVVPPPPAMPTPTADEANPVQNPAPTPAPHAAAPVTAAPKPHKAQAAGPQHYASTGNFAPPPPNDAGIDVIPAPPPNTAPPPCRECGTVEAVREVTTSAEGTGVGAVAGGVLGGLLGHQVGRGKGNTAATIVGALGGAVAGNQVEKHVRADTKLEVTVRFADGGMRSIMQEGGTRWQVGDHVRLSNGALIPD
jgi:uncharacterized protein YcfJ